MLSVLCSRAHTVAAQRANADSRYRQPDFVAPITGASYRKLLDRSAIQFQQFDADWFDRQDRL